MRAWALWSTGISAGAANLFDEAAARKAIDAAAEALERHASVDAPSTSPLTMLDAADRSLTAIDTALGLGTEH